MNADLQGQVALVTGAGRGIGRAIALALAGHGAHVIAAARTAEQIESVAREIIDAGGKATPIPVDVTGEQSVAALFESVRGQLGRLDILINNAGIGLYGPVKDFPVGEFDRVMAVNLRGTFLCCQEAMRLMVPQASGCIVNISSVVGVKGYPNQAAYTASKHGVMGLTKSLAVEAQEHGIRVSAILPGGVDTHMAGQARPDLDRSILIEPDDIARTVIYLLSLSGRAHVDQICIRRLSGTPF